MRAKHKRIAGPGILRPLHGMIIAIVAFGLAMLAGASPALAAGEGPQWTVTAVSRPTNFAPADATGDDSYVVMVTNTGGAATNGEPVSITDELPEGLSLDQAGASQASPMQNFSLEGKLSCVFRTCTYTGVVAPDETLNVKFPVDVAATEGSSLTNVVHVSGGGAPAAGVQTPTTISSEPAAFGVSPGGASAALSSVQAGAHPDLTTALAFNTVDDAGALAGDFKNVTFTLPPGFVADLLATPACGAAVFLELECPTGTQVGVTTLTLQGTVTGTYVEPVYNLAPGPGEAARLGFEIAGVYFYEGDINIQPGDYAAETTFYNANQSQSQVDNVSLTVWGVPSEAVHNRLRWKLGEKGRGTSEGGFGAEPEDPSPAPFFTSPTSCTAAPLEGIFSVNSWQHPEERSMANVSFGPLVGCDRLSMQPAVVAEATTSHASSPTGLDLGMTIPQADEGIEGLATSTLNRAVVTLPEGMTVNPSAGAGLGACSEAEFAEEAAQLAAGKGCPNESKLGTVSVETPVLAEKGTGSVYLASPAPNGEAGRNPFNSLLALYVVVRFPNRGIVVKIAGKVEPNRETGRLVTTFEDLPPLPFNQFTFRFNQGSTSPLVTPPTCGSYAVQAGLTPLANPSQLLAPEIATFPISSAFDGGPCPGNGVPPFSPQVSAGTQNNSAGSYSPLDIRITRGDGEQEITGFSSQMPLGLTANLTGIPFCSEEDIAIARHKTGGAEEAEPSCPVASQIGTTMAGAGVGPILAYAPGKVYLAGPLEGAPFSIVAITAAKVGPFDLGTVVVHLPLEINPLTAAVTVGAGSADQIPHIIDGIVIHLREIQVDINRPNFTLNPTSCAPMVFGATVMGSGASFTNPADDVPVTVNDPFQAVNCQALSFKPVFQVTTTAKTSKADGASLTVKLTYPTAPQGSQANIRAVKVDLPIQLPSRLTTLQKACLSRTFEANPAACPADSRVGQAKAVTPILPVPLTGPAYFVSYGGAKFPELVLVLQGYGITIDLHGETFIKNGITSSTFRTVPDQPVTSFELTLPEGPYSALAAYGNLCSPTREVTVRKTVTERTHGHTKHVLKKVKENIPTTLQMPTAFTAQNGAEIHQTTAISVTGCPKAKTIKTKKTKKSKSKRTS